MERVVKEHGEGGEGACMVRVVKVHGEGGEGAW